jgi:hypothetical protein
MAVAHRAEELGFPSVLPTGDCHHVTFVSSLGRGGICSPLRSTGKSSDRFGECDVRFVYRLKRKEQKQEIKKRKDLYETRFYLS